MGAVQRLATVVVLGLVALASVLILYLADEPNRLESQAENQQHDAIERGQLTYLSLCIQCHGPGGEGRTAPGEEGTGRIGAPIGGDTPNRLLNQTGLNQTGDNAGKPWSDPNNPQYGSGLEGRGNFIRNRIHVGMKLPNGTVLMPAFGQNLNGSLNDSQIDELVVFIQHADWNEVYNAAIEQYGGYPTPVPSEAAATPVPAGGGEASPVAGGGGTSFDITLVDLAFEPNDLTIPSDTDVTINLHNTGSLPHNFSIPSQNISVDVGPGETQTAKLNLPAGKYDFDCDVPGHKDAGMVGTITAAPNAGAGGGGAATPTAAANGGQAAAPSGPIEVDMQDSLTFEPAEITIPANTDVVIHAVNSGALPHTLTIKDVADTGEVAGGSSADITVNLPPGEYPFQCDVPGHADAGMVGKIIVK